MTTSIIITFAGLLLAIVFAVRAERKSGSPRERWFPWVRAALIAMYGVCVGLASMALIFFFDLDEWVVLALALPLGVPVMILAMYLSE